MCTTEVKEESKPKTLVEARERARAPGSERHTDVAKQKQSYKKTTFERQKDLSCRTTTAHLDTSCQTDGCMIDHMSFI